MIWFGLANLPSPALADQYQKTPGPFDHYPTLLNWFKLIQRMFRQSNLHRILNRVQQIDNFAFSISFNFANMTRQLVQTSWRIKFANLKALSLGLGCQMTGCDTLKNQRLKSNLELTVLIYTVIVNLPKRQENRFREQPSNTQIRV